MKKTFRKQQEESQIIFRNMPNEPKFNPNKTIKYYAIIETEGTNKLYHYEGKQRNEAREHFEEQARLDHGKIVSGINVFK
jgi:hypothetical protein